MKVLRLIVIKFVFNITTVVIVLVAIGCSSDSAVNNYSVIGQNINIITNKTQGQQVNWIIPTYCGLTIGKSTKTDVEHIFGKPIWSGEPEQEGIYENSKKELLYEYNDVCNFKGRTSIFLDSRKGVLKAISLYPQQLSLKQVLEQYGDQYIERGSSLGPCPTEDEKHNYKSSKIAQHPIFLVYPQLGLYISIQKDESVLEIGYVARCP